MSATLVESLQLVDWGARNASAAGAAAPSPAADAGAPGPESGAAKAVRTLGLALGVALFMLCAVLVEWRSWVLRRRELLGEAEHGAPAAKEPPAAREAPAASEALAAREAPAARGAPELAQPA